MRILTTALALGALLVAAPAFALGPPATPDQPPGGWTGTDDDGGGGNANPSWFDRIQGQEFRDWQDASNDSGPGGNTNGTFGGSGGDN